MEAGVRLKQLHAEIYETLKDVARGRGVTYYSDIAPLAGLDMSEPQDRKKIGDLLGDISIHEHQQGRPLLSAVVVHRGEGLPGNGFFSLARELNLYRGDDREAFFYRELGRVHDYWGR